MKDRILRIFSKIKSFPYILLGHARPSYAQFGEDRILEYLFKSLNIDKPFYLEIGTNHPIKGNNTYFFYTQGANGVLVEPDIYYHQIIKNKRSRDILVKEGVTFDETEKADFYVFDLKYTGWNTFSTEEVEMREKQGIPYKKKVKVDLISIKKLLDKYCKGRSIDLLSLDVEGLDEMILKAYDFENYAPKIICVEIIRFGESSFKTKEEGIISFLEDKGYELYANTYVNGIFVHKNFNV
jgi:FkbM family methyltransferase